MFKYKRNCGNYFGIKQTYQELFIRQMFTINDLIIGNLITSKSFVCAKKTNICLIGGGFDVPPNKV